MSWLSFRWFRLTFHFVSVKSALTPQPMCSLWTAVATTMLHWFKLLKNFVGLYLSRRQAMALLACVQASNLCDDDRHRVTHILRTMLRLPDEALQEPSSPAVPLPARPPRHATRQPQSVNASCRQKQDIA
jgi:hypothetical protein